MGIVKLNEDKQRFFNQSDDEILEFINSNFGEDILEDIPKFDTKQIECRIKHCTKRIEECELQYKGKEDKHTFYAGEKYGYWKGLKEGLERMLDY